MRPWQRVPPTSDAHPGQTSEGGAGLRSRAKLGILGVLVIVLAGVVVFQATRRSPKVDLWKASASIHSQLGEDGVIAAIFQIIEPSRRFAVEFGCSDGITNSNVRHLIAREGWSGLLLDGDERLVQIAKKNYADLPKATIANEWVYPGNVEILFEQYGVPKDVDMVVIDIDSNDYYVWRAITEFRPKVVLIEFNANFPPPQRRVVRFHPMNYWDGSDYYGASMQSLVDLGKKKGYELVFCNGLNLFFVDAQYFPSFGIEDNSPTTLYRPPPYAGEAQLKWHQPRGGGGPNGYGHPSWDKFEVEVDGKKVKPYDKDLTWDAFKIPKKWVELP